MNKLFLLLIAACCIGFTAKAQRYFQFAHVSDTHIGGAPTAVDDLRATVRDINDNPDLKFVIITGDITEFGADVELREAKTILDSLNKPWYIIPGNHDGNWSESGANSFRTVFGAETTTFQYGGFLFAGTACGPNMRMGPGQVPHEDIVWLDSVLRHLPHPDMPVIYLNHYPQDSAQNNWYEAIDLLKRHNVQLVLCGHGHSNHLLNFEGIPGIMGRSNLRARDTIGGYNIVTIHDDTVLYRQKRPGQPQGPVWARALLFNHHFASDTTKYYRPSFAVNSEYPQVHKIWEYQGKSDIGTGNVPDGDKVIGTDTDGWIFALDRRSGKKVWGFRTGGKIYSTPAVGHVGGGNAASDGYVVVASTDKNIYCLRDGRLVWKFATEKPDVACPVIAAGRVYIGGSGGHFRAIDLRTGRMVWDFDQVKGFVVDKPLIYRDVIYFGCWANDFYALDKNNGRLVWKWNSGASNRMFSPAACWPVATGGRVFIVAPDNVMTALDAASGKVIWRSRAPKLRVRESMGLSADSSLVYVKTMEGIVIGVSTTADSLRIDWRSPVGLGYELAPTALFEKNGILLVPTHSGSVWALASKDGHLLWRYKASNCMVNGILPVGQHSYVISTMDGKLTRIDVRP
ncbi:MAG TPA: PQQ-binding-like beta-propeller repeat protein [Puia sp.]|jgi:outer membrane protein assembly factor BamB/calcineurin-like phosphoesterase family protein|nr:PQQ-binding-like beta-propeller repeat protein [Puia sp.]